MKISKIPNNFIDNKVKRGRYMPNIKGLIFEAESDRKSGLKRRQSLSQKVR